MNGSQCICISRPGGDIEMPPCPSRLVFTLTRRRIAVFPRNFPGTGMCCIVFILMGSPDVV